MKLRKRVLVTGGAGFIGSHLCDRLVALGHDVLCVDNCYTGSKDNVQHLYDESRFEFMRHDITFPLYVEVDEIYNLACPASPIHYQRNPVQTTKTSVIGTINLLGLAKRTGARMLQASTSEVYGYPEKHPQSETYWGHVNPIGPRACYNEGKRCAEALCFDYYRQYDLPIRVARIFNTYGPRMAVLDGRVVSNFIVAALSDEPLQLYGDGSQTRSFCYVDDLVRGLMLMMEAGEEAVGPINLGTQDELSMQAIAEKVLKLLPESSSKTMYADSLEDDPRNRRPNTERAEAVLGWRPEVSLHDGLSKTIDYFRDTLAAERVSIAHHAHLAST